MKKLKTYIKLFALIFLLNLTISAQTAEELNKKYGEPVNDIYKLSDKISLGVEYGEDQNVCYAAISKPQSFEMPVFRPKGEKVENKDIEKEQEKDVDFWKLFYANNQSGKLLKDLSSTGNCYYKRFMEYENISIVIGVESCEKTNYASTSVISKRSACRKLIESKRFPFFLSNVNQKK